MDSKLLPFAERARRHPEQLAVIGPDGRGWSCGELVAASHRLARALRSAGAKCGDVIALVAPNCVEYFTLQLAATQIGMYFVPLNWHLTAHEFAHVLNDCRPAVLVVHERCRTSVMSCLASLENVPPALVAIGTIAGLTSLETFVSGHSSHALENRTPGHVMFYSSATTGRPAAVRYPLNRAVFEPVRTLRLLPAPPGRENVHLCTTMLYHAAGLLHATTALFSGHTLVLMDTWTPEAMLECIQRHRVTTTAVVPTMFVRLLRLPQERRAACDVTSLVQVIHGAAPCPIPIKQQMLAWLGPILWEYYCGTEGIGTFATPSDWQRFPGTVGRAFPGIRIRILNEHAQEQAPGIEGDIYLRAANGWTFEYHNDKAKTAGCFRDDYFTLGDRGYLNPQGYLFLSGRRTDLINCAGVKIYPAEIEQALLEHPAVLDCAVVGAPHELFGQVPRAVVQLTDAREGSPRLTAELFEFLAKRVATLKLPRQISYASSLPRAPNGKLYRRFLTGDNNHGRGGHPDV
jgi:long-chain acyl-CoA synthetase